MDQAPQEEPSFWTTFSESFSAGITELSEAITETGNAFSASLTQAWEEWTAEAQLPTLKQSDRLEILEKAAVDWDKKVAEVWRASLEESAIHIDIPRLITKIRIQNNAGDVLFAGETSEDEANIEAQVMKFFEFLANHFNDEAFKNALEFLKPLVGKEVFTNSIKKMLEQPGTSDSPSVKVLKGMHQKILFPAYYHIKYLLRLHQMKDKAGTWQIIVVLGDEAVMVKHVKTQIVLAWMLSDKASEMSEQVVVEAEWELQLNFDPKTVELNSVETRISGGSFQAEYLEPNMLEHYENQLKLARQ